jgi:hypothetical protein
MEKSVPAEQSSTKNFCTPTDAAATSGSFNDWSIPNAEKVAEWLLELSHNPSSPTDTLWKIPRE